MSICNTMKKLLIIAAVSFALAAARTESQPAPTALPRGVREMAPTGIKTVRLMTFRLGARNSSVLIHVWTVARGPQNSIGYANDVPENVPDKRGYISLPFCADVYVPSGRPNEWRWVNAIDWRSNREPRSISARWLLPRQKRGLVLLINATERDARGHRTIIAAFPDGVQGELSLQNYQGNGSSSGSTYYSFDRVDKRGWMVITEKRSTGGGPMRHIDHHWDVNRRQFMPTSSTAP